ncbi:MAG TPA: pentapeptide repeat-containing protein [Roseiarcus sp.]|nr:pentapeptide repeat-containing protein [Roseiarcus sp.]
MTKVSLHDWVFNGPVDDTTRRRKSLFSSTLVLPGLNIYEGLNIDDPEKAKWRDFVFRARGRDLRGAIFDLASLPKVDFDGAELRGASFEGAHLQGASLDEAKLQGASLVGSTLQGASLDRAELQGVSLKGAHLEGASLNAAQLQVAFLVGAHLQGVSLNEAQLQGALLVEAQLQGAFLNAAELQGASLYSARLQGASLDNAQLQGASLVDAQLQGALLDTTQLQGASLDRAQLAGADLNAAHLEGASLFHARLQGALLQAAVLRATDLSYAYLWRTNRGARSYVGAHWYVNDVKLSGAQWQPSSSDEEYQGLRQTMESLPPGRLRDQALDRIRKLDCANPEPTLASCDPSQPPPAEAFVWQKALEDARVDDAAYAKALTKTLKALVCSGREDAPRVLRGMMDLFPSRLEAAGPDAPALVDFIMSKDCPVLTSLTDGDKATLLRIKEDAIKRPGG